VVPRLAPKITPIPCVRVISPAPKKEIVSTETRELDCIILVERIPNKKMAIPAEISLKFGLIQKLYASPISTIEKKYF